MPSGSRCLSASQFLVLNRKYMPKANGPTNPRPTKNGAIALIADATGVSSGSVNPGGRSNVCARCTTRSPCSCRRTCSTCPKRRAGLRHVSSTVPAGNARWMYSLSYADTSRPSVRLITSRPSFSAGSRSSAGTAFCESPVANREILPAGSSRIAKSPSCGSVPPPASGPGSRVWVTPTPQWATAPVRIASRAASIPASAVTWAAFNALSNSMSCRVPQPL